MIDFSVSDDSLELILAVDFPRPGERQHWKCVGFDLEFSGALWVRQRRRLTRRCT